MAQILDTTMTNQQMAELKKLVTEGLDQAEEIWAEVGHNFDAVLSRRSISNEAVQTQIPGHTEVSGMKPQIDDFVALVADMRDSTRHLMQNTADADVSELQRLFYETSALLPALGRAITFGGGNVTEYLGDGVLALFQAGKDQRPDAVYAAHEAAKNCLSAVSDVMNPEIGKRYRLPPVAIGVGLSFSKAIVTLVGDPKRREAKVFGECVYYASKLASGRNEIYVDAAMNKIWPTSKDGRIHFLRKRIKDVDGYLIA